MPAAPAAAPTGAPTDSVLGAPEAAATVSAKEVARARTRNPIFPLGVSLYPVDEEAGERDLFYAGNLGDDLDLLHGARFGLVRVFVSWRVLEPQVSRYDEDALQHLADIIASIRTHGMQAIVCFFADDSHSDLVDVAWGVRRDPRTDGYLIQREVSLVQEVIRQLRGDAGVFAWQLANEAFLSGFTEKHELDEWTRILREAVREVDPKRPIALGADAETLMRATGVDARDAIATCEFSVSHVTAAYRAYAAEGPVTSGPSTYLEAFLLHLADRGNPIVSDDAGVLSLDFSPVEEAAALRTSLWTALANRSAGVLARRLRDLATERREPYFVDPFESLVGVTDSYGQPKPSFTEMQSFVRSVARIDLKHHVPAPERTAVIMPAERFNPLPDLASLVDPRSCLAAFTGAKRAHLPVTVAYETDDLSAYSVLILPSAFNLLDDTWERLTEFVQAGGALVLSYGGGDAHPGIRELFGVEFRGDDGPRELFSCRVAHADVLGALESFDARFAVSNFAQLGGGSATIVATDEQGSPLLTVNAVGQGRAVYIAAPIERGIAQGDPWATPAPVAALLSEVYGAVARSAGCIAPIDCDSPDIEVSLLQGDADDVALLINHAPARIEATFSADRGVAQIADVRGGSPVLVDGRTFSVAIEANGALALRLTYAREEGGR
ncbi:MAG: cellulase family glycosylhydrolase [Coriobacteriia bacterium]|nr:cellulase family glycosylhydrolase [Coriobacteriia bacterium]